MWKYLKVGKIEINIREMKNLIPIIAGAVLGIVTWKFSAYSADFGLGPLIWILICTIGGWYTWGK